MEKEKGCFKMYSDGVWYSQNIYNSILEEKENTRIVFTGNKPVHMNE